MNNSNHNYCCHLIVALACEAKPLIKHYELKRCVDESAFPVFRNKTMTLTISGVGKLAAAAAVAYTHGRYASTQAAIWLNIGVAGHPTIDPGECRMAHKVTDSETNRQWFPGIIFTSPCKTSDLLTVGKPETNYSQNVLYEMETAGFLATAVRFESLEMIHALKVISDNRSTPAPELNEKKIHSLIGNQLNTIDELINELEMLRQQSVINQTADCTSFLSKWHFTNQQAIQLASLLSQWNIRSGDTFPVADDIPNLRTSKHVIRWLKSQVSSLPVRF